MSIIGEECIVLLPCTLLAHEWCKDTYISLNKDANERLIYSIRLILSQCPFLYDAAYMFLGLLNIICKTSVSTKKKRGLHDILSDTNVVYYHEKKVYTHADIHYRNMVDANVQAVAQPQNPNSHGEVNAQSQSPNPYGEVNVQPQNQNPYGEVNGQPQNQNPYEKVNTQPQNQDNKSVYSNDTEDFDNTDNAEVSSVKTVHPQNMPSGYFEDADDKDGK